MNTAAAVDSPKDAPLLSRLGTRVENFLYFSAGADRDLLARSPYSDRVKLQGIGGVVATTGGLAFLSGSYAFYTIFSPKAGYLSGGAAEQASSLLPIAVAVFFGLVWALIIYNLDRFIVAASGSGDGTDEMTWKEWKTAIPRLLLAIAIGLVLAVPLELRIMKTEIEAALSKRQEARLDELNAQDSLRFEEARKRLDGERTRILDEIQKRETILTKLDGELSELTFRLQQELAGEGGSGRRGVGPVAEQNERLRKIQEDRVNNEKSTLQPQIDQLRKEFDDVQRRTEAHLAEKNAVFEDNRRIAAQDDGLMVRQRLASEISPLGALAIKLLLILLEIAPILFKMMLNAGPYEYFSENEKRLAYARRGIDIFDRVSPQGATIVEVKKARFAEAEAALEHESGKWDVEARLTRLAYAAYEKHAGEDIARNPDRYMEAPGARAPGRDRPA